MNKKILVLAKLCKGDLSPFDGCALECALSLENASVAVLAMAPPQMEESLASLTRLGVKAILLADPCFAGSDTIATSRILAKAISLLSPDIIFAGRESMDGNTAQVPLMLSELTGYSLFQKAMSFDGERFTNRNGDETDLRSEQIITFEKFRLLRPPSIFSKKGEVERIDNKILGLPPSKIGLLGSPTRVIATHANTNNRRLCRFINYDELDHAIEEGLSKTIGAAPSNARKGPLVHYVGRLADVASCYGEEAKEIDLQGLRTTEEIASKIMAIGPKLLLWEECDSIKEIASKVASALGQGLCADCTSVAYDGERYILTRPALGGDVLADIVCISDIAMATMKAKASQGPDIAISIGRGALPHLEKVRLLAKRLNAPIYCSRPLTDNGEFPYSSQVGLTGISIAPKVAISIGCSGAIQHIVGIERAGTIIAINIDGKAKTFDYADYGIVMDAKDL